MKGYKASSGWLVRCVDGPLDGGFIRSWCLKDTPEAEAAALPQQWFSTVHEDDKGTSWYLETRANYQLVPSVDKKGNQKMAKHLKVSFPMSHYQWCELEELMESPPPEEPMASTSSS